LAALLVRALVVHEAAQVLERTGRYGLEACRRGRRGSFCAAWTDEAFAVFHVHEVKSAARRIEQRHVRRMQRHIEERDLVHAAFQCAAEQIVAILYI